MHPGPTPTHPRRPSPHPALPPGAPPQKLYVVNVHLEGSPYRPNDRISQLKHALHRLQMRQASDGAADTLVGVGSGRGVAVLAMGVAVPAGRVPPLPLTASVQEANGEEPEACDVVVCGDFNSLPGDAPYLFLKSGRLDRGHTEAYLPQVGAALQHLLAQAVRALHLPVLGLGLGCFESACLHSVCVRVVCVVARAGLPAQSWPGTV